MTKIEAVRFAIEKMESMQRMVSVNGKRMMPLSGQEEKFYELEDAIIQLKAICQAMQTESVRKSIAEWQMKIMTEPDAVETAMLDMDRMGATCREGQRAGGEA